MRREAIVTAVQQTYQALALADPERAWELAWGEMREKPSMGVAHNRVMMRLTRQIIGQLDFDRFEIRTNCARLIAGEHTYFIPDVCVVPLPVAIQQSPAQLEVFASPLPFVVEIGSPSTGAYDIDAKLPVYQQRGDDEIWRIHPFERSAIIWRRQPDGSYVEFRAANGTVEIASLPGVTVNLDALLA